MEPAVAEHVVLEPQAAQTQAPLGGQCHPHTTAADRHPATSYPTTEVAADNSPPAHSSHSATPVTDDFHTPSAVAPSHRSTRPASCPARQTSSTSRTPAESRSPTHRLP